MPFYKKGNKTPANGKRRKTGSSVINSFKRYNTPNVTSQGIKNFLIYNFYKVGYNIDAACKMTAKGKKKRKFVQKLPARDFFLYKISLHKDIKNKRKV